MQEGLEDACPPCDGPRPGGQVEMPASAVRLCPVLAAAGRETEVGWLRCAGWRGGVVARRRHARDLAVGCRRHAGRAHGRREQESHHGCEQPGPPCSDIRDPCRASDEPGVDHQRDRPGPEAPRRERSTADHHATEAEYGGPWPDSPGIRTRLPRTEPKKPAPHQREGGDERQVSRRVSRWGPRSRPSIQTPVEPSRSQCA